MNINRVTKWSAMLLLVVTVTMSLTYWQTESDKPELTFKKTNTNASVSVSSQTPIVGNVENPQDSKLVGEELSFEIDGELITITLKELEVNAFSLPNKSASYLYEKLSERALNGEPLYARLLSDLINSCSDSFIDEDDHKLALDRLIKDKKLPSANPKFDGAKVPDDMIEFAVNQVEEQFKYCKELTVVQRGEYSRWAKMAVDGGDFLALENLANHPETPSAERLDLYERQWLEHGYINATTALSLAYSGTKHSLFEGVEPNLEKAYANYLISRNLDLSIAKHQGKDSYAIAELNANHDIYESLLTSKLSAREHIDAEKLAKEMIKSNSNCCAIDPRATISIPHDN